MEYLSFYMLAIALGVSSSYFDGPVERHMRNFELWWASVKELAVLKDMVPELMLIKTEFDESNSLTKKTLPIMRTIFFISAIIPLLLATAFSSWLQDNVHLKVSGTICILQLTLIFLFQLIVSFKNSKVRSQMSKFHSKLI